MEVAIIVAFAGFFDIITFVGMFVSLIPLIGQGLAAMIFFVNIFLGGIVSLWFFFKEERNITAWLILLGGLIGGMILPVKALAIIFATMVANSKILAAAADAAIVAAATIATAEFGGAGGAVAAAGTAGEGAAAGGTVAATAEAGVTTAGAAASEAGGAATQGARAGIKVAEESEEILGEQKSPIEKIKESLEKLPEPESRGEDDFSGEPQEEIEIPDSNVLDLRGNSDNLEEDEYREAA